MKTKEELKALKEEMESLHKKLTELSEEELAQINGGSIPHIPGLPIGQIKGDWGVREYEIFLTGHDDK